MVACVDLFVMASTIEMVTMCGMGEMFCRGGMREVVLSWVVWLKWFLLVAWVWWFVIKYIGTMAYYGLSCIA